MSVAAAVAESSEMAGGGLVAAAGKYLAAHEPDKQAIRPSLSVRTARSWRGILVFTHLAREGRMTVTIDGGELRPHSAARLLRGSSRRAGSRRETC
jgi:hypothetical protein